MNQKQLDVLKKNNDESRSFTRDCISIGLINLLSREKEDYKNITITKLCTVAGVSRAAFYRNYNSIDEVLVDRIKEFAISLNSLIESDIYNNWLNIFKAVDENRFLIETLINAGFEKTLLDTFLSLLPETRASRNIQSIWLSIIYTLIIRWVKEKKPKKVEDMAKVAYKYTKNLPLVEQ